LVTLGQPGEQAGAEGDGQDDRPGAVAVDGDEDLALVHGDVDGSKGDDLDGGHASGDEGDKGSVAQSDSSARADSAGIDAGKDSVGVLGIESHQDGFQ
jgi:hypothetical protein